MSEAEIARSILDEVGSRHIETKDPGSIQEWLEQFIGRPISGGGWTITAHQKPEHKQVVAAVYDGRMGIFQYRAPFWFRPDMSGIFSEIVDDGTSVCDPSYWHPVPKGLLGFYPDGDPYIPNMYMISKCIEALEAQEKRSVL